MHYHIACKLCIVRPEQSARLEAHGRRNAHAATAFAEQAHVSDY